MLFKRPVLDRVAAGGVILAFRRWRRPTVRAGGTPTTPAAVPAIDIVTADRERIAEGLAPRP